MPFDRRFPVMGARARIWLVGGPDDLADRLVERADELERRWSRFLPDSDTSRMNGTPGEPVQVHPDTVDLVRHAMAAVSKTGGRFDPTMGRQIADAGYHLPFDQVVQQSGGFAPTGEGTVTIAADPITVTRAPAGERPRVAVDKKTSTVTVPHGIAFDPGGIGKGRAADLIAEEALFCGAESVFIDIGGDVRMAGDPPSGGWPLYVDDPKGGADPLATLRLPSSGVATSSVHKRRWVTASGPQHHLLDPDTGFPSSSDLMAVTVVANETWWAEAIATAAVVSGRDAAHDLIAESGSTGLVVGIDGDVEYGPGLSKFLSD